MFELIKKYKIILIIGSLILLIIFGVILYFQNNAKPSVITNSDSVDQELGYPFLLDETPKEDQYLMLLGLSMTENFGTSELGDDRPLQDLFNQSSESFGVIVQKKIDSIVKSKNITTLVQADSIYLERVDSSKVIVSMKATATDNISGKTTPVDSSVTLIKQSTFWLVDNIELINR